jgi:hypothetical protein
MVAFERGRDGGGFSPSLSLVFILSASLVLFLVTIVWGSVKMKNPTVSTY